MYSSQLLLSLLSALPALVSSQDWALTQLSEVLSYQSERFTECTNFISTCQPTISSCASAVCAQCTGLGAKALNSCCAGDNPVSCFSSINANEASSPATVSDAVTTGTGDAPPPACTSFVNIISSCEAATPGFDSLSDSDAASCLCYDSATNYIAQTVDGYVSSCADFWSTEDPSEYSTIVGLEGFCQSVGDVRGANGGSSLSTSSANGFGSSAASTSTRGASTSRASAGSSVTSSGPVATSTNAGAKTDIAAVHVPIAVVFMLVAFNALV